MVVGPGLVLVIVSVQVIVSVSVQVIVSPMSIVIPTVIVTVAVNPYPSGFTSTARGVTSGASTSLGMVAATVGVNVGIEPSTLYVDSAIALVAHSDRQASENLIVDLFDKQSRTVSRPSAAW